VTALPAPAASGYGLLTAAQVAMVAGVSEDTVRRWVKQGKLRPHMAGGVMGFREREIRALFAPAVETGAS